MGDRLLASVLAPSASSTAVGRLVPVDDPTGPRCVVSLHGRRFDPMSPRWLLSKDVTLAMATTVGRLDPALGGPYRKVMTYYAKNHAPSSCKNVETCLHHFLDETEHRTFSDAQLRNYRARLDRYNEWKLATLRAFLKCWHGQGYPGVSDDAVEYLDSLRLKGNEKGKPVLSLDPRSRSFRRSGVGSRAHCRVPALRARGDRPHGRFSSSSCLRTPVVVRVSSRCFARETCAGLSLPMAV